MPCIGQGVAGGVPEHVAMQAEREARTLTDALYKPIHSIRRERASADLTACRHSTHDAAFSSVRVA